MDTTLEAPHLALSAREDFAELSRRVRDSGLLARRRGYYSAKIATSVGARALSRPLW